MKNTSLLNILHKAIQENTSDALNEKLIMIDDIIRVKKTLFGFGYIHHDEFLSDYSAAKLFDELYEMNIEQLQLINAGYEKQVNEHISAQKLTN